VSSIWLLSRWVGPFIRCRTSAKQQISLLFLTEEKELIWLLRPCLDQLQATLSMFVVQWWPSVYGMPWKDRYRIHCYCCNCALAASVSLRLQPWERRTAKEHNEFPRDPLRGSYSPSSPHQNNPTQLHWVKTRNTSDHRHCRHTGKVSGPSSAASATTANSKKRYLNVGSQLVSQWYVKSTHSNFTDDRAQWSKKNSVAWVRKRTMSIPPEWPPLFGEVSAKFWGEGATWSAWRIRIIVSSAF
jgi:hypothetical protein